MKSLISESSRAKVEHSAASTPLAVNLDGKTRRLVAAAALIVVAIIVFVVTNPFGDGGVAITPHEQQKSTNIAANIRELEEADRRMASTTNPPPSPSPGAPNQPKNLRQQSPH